MTYSEQTRNLYSIIDSIDFIIKNEDKLTTSEKENLVDPLSISSVLLRKVLGNIFKGFEIRKNADNYSIRCNDPELYKLLYFHSIFSSTVADDNVRLAPDLRAIMTSTYERVNVFFTCFRAPDLYYKFRSDSRFFLYVGHTSYANHLYREGSSRSNFIQSSFASKVNTLRENYEILKLIELPQVVSKYVDFINRFGNYYSRYLHFNFRENLITEDFLDYALSQEEGSIQQISREYVEKNKREEEIQVVMPIVPEVVVTETVPIIVPVVDGNHTATAEAQALFRESLARTTGARNTTNLITHTNPEGEPIQQNTRQNAFIDALERVRAQNRDERFLRINADRVVNDTQMLETDDFIEGRLIEREFIGTSEYLRLLMKLPEGKAENLLPAYCQDLFDDSCLGGSGLYFTVRDNKIEYLIYRDGKLILNTQDYDLAFSYYKDNYGETEEIRYLEVNDVGN